jgi:lipid-binding SYLF domain-containing protein
MTQGSVGFQAGGKAYSQIIFFQDRRALDEFESGTFEFAAGASVTAITASAGGAAGSAGAAASASGTVDNGTTASTRYNKGLVVFAMAKGSHSSAAQAKGPSPRRNDGRSDLFSCGDRQDMASGCAAQFAQRAMG